MRGFFGFIELFLGIFLLFLVIGSTIFIVYFGPNIMDKYFSINPNQIDIMPLIDMNSFILGLVLVGFEILFFTLSIILIIGGILDLKGE